MHRLNAIVLESLLKLVSFLQAYPYPKLKTQNLKRILLITFSLLVFSNSCDFGGTTKSGQLSAQPPQLEPYLDPKQKQKYHQIVKEFLDRRLPRNFNGSILIAKDGVPVYEEYRGFRDLRLKDSLTAETPFQIASTSKPFTAAAVLRLAQEGRLSLNDPVYKFFPGFPYAEVTVQMLLNHRSGLPNYLNYFEHNGWNRTTPATNEDVINTLITWQPPRAYKPNTNFNYCNTNYVLLASIVERVSGQPFAQFMKDNFFDPLGMKNTFVLTLQDSARATPSFDGYGGYWQHDFSDGPYGDKNIYSTPRDLLKWDRAWYSNIVLNQQMKDSAFTAYSHERPGTHHYGLGWRLLMLPNDKKVIYHNGRWHGFNTAFARLTEEKVTIIILSNKFSHSVYKLSRDMYDIFGNYDNNEDAGEE